MVNDDVIYPKSRHTYEEQKNLSLGYPRQDFSRFRDESGTFRYRIIRFAVYKQIRVMHEPEINTSLFGRKSGDFESGIYT